jgi:glycosyltransferase involved in cell wall biosynthesis
MNDSLKTRPRLSIGLPVYNGARFLPAALDSLLGQTFGDFELILSDNASTDETAEIAQEYAQRDGRIEFIRHEHNQGAAWNFNFVAERSSGEYFKWAAADDVCAPTFLQRCVEVLDRDPSVVCCHARTRKINEYGELIEGLDDPTDGGLPTRWFQEPTAKQHRPDASSPRASRRFADVVLFSGWAARSYSIFRMSALRQTSLLLPYYGSEKLTMVELALRGRFYDVPETLFFQRVHEGCSSRLKTSGGQQQYITGNSAGRQSPRLQLLRDYIRAISSSPLPLGERAACYAWLLRYLLQFRKWPEVLSATLRGGGVGSASKPAAVKAAAASTAAVAP